MKQKKQLFILAVLAALAVLACACSLQKAQTPPETAPVEQQLPAEPSASGDAAPGDAAEETPPEQAAEAAAQQYLENIERMSGQQETICRDMQAEAEAKAAEIVREAQEYSKKTHAEADAYWKQIVARVRALLKERDALRELIQTAGRNEEK